MRAVVIQVVVVIYLGSIGVYPLLRACKCFGIFYERVVATLTLTL